MSRSIRTTLVFAAATLAVPATALAMRGNATADRLAPRTDPITIPVAATVSGYTGGVLTLGLAAGGQVAGAVTAATRFDCPRAGAHSRRHAPAVRHLAARRGRAGSRGRPPDHGDGRGVPHARAAAAGAAGHQRHVIGAGRERRRASLAPALRRAPGNDQHRPPRVDGDRRRDAAEQRRLDARQAARPEHDDARAGSVGRVADRPPGLAVRDRRDRRRTRRAGRARGRGRPSRAPGRRRSGRARASRRRAA